MVRFRLRSQHTGIPQDFTLLDLLTAIADNVNDEIRFHDGNREEVYNLSTLEDLSGVQGDTPTSSVPAAKLVSEAIYFINGQRTFTVGRLPLSLCLVFLNGIKLRQGIDYNKDGKTIELLFALKAGPDHTDLLEAIYDVA